MLTIRAMSNGRGYAAHHLVHSDYYAKGKRVVGYWQGRGATELGLVGEVTEQQFEAIRQGLHPVTGETLRPRHSADRLSEDGEIQSRGDKRSVRCTCRVRRVLRCRSQSFRNEPRGRRLHPPAVICSMEG
jgi:hypothetical protein